MDTWSRDEVGDRKGLERGRLVGPEIDDPLAPRLAFASAIGQVAVGPVVPLFVDALGEPARADQPIVPVENCDEYLEQLGFPLVIVIQKHHEFGLGVCLVQTTVARPGHTDVRAGNETDSPVMGCPGHRHPAGAVRRTVVDDDELPSR